MACRLTLKSPPTRVVTSLPDDGIMFSSIVHHIHNTGELQRTTSCSVRSIRTGSGHYKNFEGIDVSLEGFVFVHEAFVPLFKVGDIFGCFGEDSCLRKIIVSFCTEAIEERENENNQIPY